MLERSARPAAHGFDRALLLAAFVANRRSVQAGGGRGARCSWVVLGSHVDWQKRWAVLR